jgi:hypothetical protein
VDDRRARALPDAAAPCQRDDPQEEGGLVALTRRLLDLFDGRRIRATFFVLGDVAARRPGLVAEIAGAATRSPATARTTWT